MKSIIKDSRKLLILFMLMGLGSVNQMHAQSFDSKFVNQSIPDRMIPGSKYNIILSFQNSGTDTWTPGVVRLKILPDDENKALWSVSELELTKMIEPGNTATIELTVTAPSAAGVYKLAGRLTASGSYFGEQSKILEISVNSDVSLTEALNSAAFVEQTVPSIMEAGKKYKVMISYTNTGKTTWNQNSYRLIMLDAAGNPLTGNFWNTYSVSLDENISPGSSKVFNFDIIPFAAGTYTLQWRLASGETGLFGDLSNPAVVTVIPVPEIKNEGKSGKQ
ncbi:MAG: hypothetical protein HOP31_11590 [Ignavibacteria bacterium]|nr:hypothetical protein [Ignavibacteria bacterium]